MAREVAVGKRIKINKYQQQMLGLALLASVVFGVCIVLGVFFVKYISFNSKVIVAKDKAIADYDTAIKNSDTLENLVLGLADDERLESVARGTTDSKCFEQNSGNGEKVKINYEELYRKETDETKAREYLEAMKTCSALRVVPDALPAHKNTEALMASLDQIFRVSGWEPESLSPSSSTTTNNNIKNINVIPVGLSVAANTATTFRVLDNIEKSIRSFDIKNATISWSGGDEDAKLELKAQANAYYVDEVEATERKEIVYASDEAKKAATGSKTTGGNKK